MIAIERRPIDVASNEFYGFYFPDLARNGKTIMCVCITAKSHSDRRENAIMFFKSVDAGESWSLFPQEIPPFGKHFNSPRISTDDMGGFVVVADQMPLIHDFPDFKPMWDSNACEIAVFNVDEERVKRATLARPMNGSCPSVTRFGGAFFMTSTVYHPERERFGIRVSGTAHDKEWNVISDRTDLTEATLVDVPGNPVLIARSNSPFEPAYRSILPGGKGNFTEPERFTMPCGGHRPTVITLADGRFFASFRLFPGGGADQNTMMALYSAHALVAPAHAQNALFRPLDHCENVAGDQGYTGACQLEDGRILVVNYMNPDSRLPRLFTYKFGLDVFGAGVLK